MDLNGGTAPASVISGEEENAGCPAHGDRSRRLPRRVLVIEDEPLQRRTISYFFRKAGFVVADAGRGHEGLRRLFQDPPDLVLTDLHLPDMSGWDVARAVRRLQLDLPVVLVTGSPGVASEPAGLRSLVSAIVPKPFEFQELLEMVNKLAVPLGAGSFLEAGRPGGRQHTDAEAPHDL